MAIQLSYPSGSALVAGGSGSVGAGITRRLAEAGLPVTFTYLHNADRAEALAETLRGEGLKVWARHMDLANADSIDAAIAFTQEKGGRLHTVASATGARVPFNNIADFTIEEVEAFFAADGMTYYRLANRVVPVMRAGGGGSITLCTTIALYRCIAFDGIAAFSKGAVDMLVRQVAWEEARHKIRCNAVPISWIHPADQSQFQAYIASKASPQKERLTALVDQLNAMLRLPGPAKPEVAGDLFAFLASDQAGFITGQSISPDGGATL